MVIQTNNDKYLVFSTDGCYKPGLDHLLAVFKGAIKEAVILGRVLVIDKYAMHPVHNRSHELSIELESYINLAETQIYKQEKNGSVKQISDTFRYIDRSNFNLDKYPQAQVLQLKGTTPITAEQNNRYKVIIRKTINYAYSRSNPDIQVSLYPSDEVNRLTDVALKAMGTSLAAVRERSTVYQNVDFATNQDIFYDRMPNHPNYYAALHIRIGNWGPYPMLQYLFPRYYYQNRSIPGNWEHYPLAKYQHKPKRLTAIVRRAVPKGSRVYIMSDMGKPGYFDFLKKDFTVYQYSDFPELEDLVSGGNNNIDNAMLYSVEKNILQYAHTKIVRANAHLPILYTTPLKWPWRVTLGYHYIKIATGLYKGLNPHLKKVSRGIKKVLYRKSGNTET